MEFGWPLGASPGLLQRNILAQTFGLAVVGLVVGTVASVMLTRGLKGLLFGVTAGDPAAFLGMVLLLAWLD